jgi:hypothetical protein
MTLDEIRFIFNRAVVLTFSWTKLLLTFAIAAVCGVFVVFFHGLSIEATQWLSMSLTFVPAFICAGVLLSAGVLLIRLYHDEVKDRGVDFQKTLANSWQVMIGASYFSVPIVLSYLLLWMILGIFVLLSTLPGIGIVFNTVLIFAPFLINLVTLCLVLLSFALLFFMTPILALKGYNRIQVSQTLVQRFNKDIFTNLLLLAIGVAPLLILSLVLLATAFLTEPLCYDCVSPTHKVLLWFFMMIPFTAILAPGVVFFFNFAAESHVLMMKKVAAQKNG